MKTELFSTFYKNSVALNGRKITNKFVNEATKKFKVENILEFRKNLCVIISTTEEKKFYGYSSDFNLFMYFKFALRR